MVKGGTKIQMGKGERGKQNGKKKKKGFFGAIKIGGRRKS